MQGFWLGGVVREAPPCSCPVGSGVELLATPEVPFAQFCIKCREGQLADMRSRWGARLFMSALRTMGTRPRVSLRDPISFHLLSANDCWPASLPLLEWHNGDCNKIA